MGPESALPPASDEYVLPRRLPRTVLLIVAEAVTFVVVHSGMGDRPLPGWVAFAFHGGSLGVIVALVLGARASDRSYIDTLHQRL